MLYGQRWMYLLRQLVDPCIGQFSNKSKKWEETKLSNLFVKIDWSISTLLVNEINRTVLDYISKMCCFFTICLVDGAFSFQFRLMLTKLIYSHPPTTSHPPYFLPFSTCVVFLLLITLRCEDCRFYATSKPADLLQKFQIAEANLEYTNIEYELTKYWSR